MIDCDQPKVCLEVVAVELRNPVTDVMTQMYALHDTGSQITMLRLPIAHKLGITGVIEQIVIGSINTCKAVDAFKTKVKVKGINCKNEYDSIRIYGVNELPVCETSLPDSLELNKYPHLCGVEMQALKRRKVEMIL